jgi:protein-arginine kinase activator protein McsA
MEICPLTGQPCSHRKCIHITECGPKYSFKNAKDLCILCGSQHLDPVNQPMPLNGIFEFFKHLILNQQALKPQGCPTCGITLLEINKTGKLGCAHCYEFFKDTLNQLLYKLHGSTQHKGKKVNELKDLEEQLAVAIKIEDYEKAVKLRDQINKLKK